MEQAKRNSDARATWWPIYKRSFDRFVLVVRYTRNCCSRLGFCRTFRGDTFNLPVTRHRPTRVDGNSYYNGVAVLKTKKIKLRRDRAIGFAPLSALYFPPASCSSQSSANDRRVSGTRRGGGRRSSRSTRPIPIDFTAAVAVFERSRSIDGRLNSNDVNLFV